jgi:hypothetical protein
MKIEIIMFYITYLFRFVDYNRKIKGILIYFNQAQKRTEGSLGNFIS